MDMTAKQKVQTSTSTSAHAVVQKSGDSVTESQRLDVLTTQLSRQGTPQPIEDTITQHVCQKSRHKRADMTDNRTIVCQ